MGELTQIVQSQISGDTRANLPGLQNKTTPSYKDKMHSAPSARAALAWRCVGAGCKALFSCSLERQQAGKGQTQTFSSEGFFFWRSETSSQSWFCSQTERFSHPKLHHPQPGSDPRSEALPAPPDPKSQPWQGMLLGTGCLSRGQRIPRRGSLLCAGDGLSSQWD